MRFQEILRKTLRLMENCCLSQLKSRSYKTVRKFHFTISCDISHGCKNIFGKIVVIVELKRFGNEKFLRNFTWK